MRVAIYHPWIYLKSGLERTIFELARRSRHDWSIFTSHYDREATYPELAELAVKELPRISVRRRYGAVLGAAARIAGTRLDAREFDVLVICCDGLGSLLTLRNRARPTVCLCFTPLRAVYDSVYRERHLGKVGRGYPAALLAERAWRWLDRWAWAQYTDVVCISETVRDRVAAGGLRDRERMRVLHPGVAAERIRPSDEAGDYFFLPGRIMWTKNIELAIEAFGRFRSRTGSATRLVISGMVDRKSEPYLEQLRARAASVPGIEFHGNVSDETMARQYAQCRVVLFTAFNEDWGLTPLEGAAFGKPTIAVNRGGPTETIVDGETGWLAPPDPEAFARVMEHVAADDAEVRRRGLAAAQHCRRFTWEHFVDGVDGCLDEAAQRCGSPGPGEPQWRTGGP